MPTYKDIQQATGLSLATISKYYNGGSVRTENRSAIESAAEQLGYRLNAAAGDLRRGSSRTIGVMLPSLENPFHMSIVARVERRLRSSGLSVVVTSTEDETPTNRSADLLLRRRVDAIVAVPSEDVVPGLERAVGAGVPVVCFDWEAPELPVDHVTLDNRAAGRAAARHLLDHGHEDVALIGGVESVPSLRQRSEGFAEIAIRPDKVEGRPAKTGPATVAYGLTAMAELLDGDVRPTAVFAVNAELVTGALIALNESGLRLGVDMSLIGFDHTDLARVTSPRLTVVEQPLDALADAVATRVLARLASDAGPPVHERLPGRVAAGGSVARRHLDDGGAVAGLLDSRTINS